MKPRRWLALQRLLLLLLALLAVPTLAHEARPAYLQLQQLDARTYDVLWKVPGLGEDKRLALDVEFPADVIRVGRVRQTFAGNAFVQRWRLQREGGLEGATDPHRRIAVHADRRAGTTGTVGRHHADDPRAAVGAILHGRSIAGALAGGRRLPRRSGSSTSCSASTTCCSCWRW